MVCDVRPRGIVLLLLEHGILRLPMPTGTLAVAYENLRSKTFVYYRNQLCCEFESAAGDAQTYDKYTACERKRMEGLERIGVSL